MLEAERLGVQCDPVANPVRMFSPAVCLDILEFSARVLIPYTGNGPKRADGRHFS